MSAKPTASSPRERQVLDDAVLAYVQWREEGAGVWESFDRWDKANSEDAARAHAAYLAALDREEAAAGVYAKRLERLGDLLREQAGV